MVLLSLHSTPYGLQPAALCYAILLIRTRQRKSKETRVRCEEQLLLGLLVRRDTHK